MRLFHRITLLLMVVTTFVVWQPNKKSEASPDLFTDTNGQACACLLGVQPAITDYKEALEQLQRHPLLLKSELTDQTTVTGWPSVMISTRQLIVTLAAGYDGTVYNIRVTWADRRGPTLGDLHTWVGEPRGVQAKLEMITVHYAGQLAAAVDGQARVTSRVVYIEMATRAEAGMKWRGYTSRYSG